MKRISLFLLAAGMLSMVACKSAPKQEATVEPVAAEETTVTDSTVTPADTTVVTPEETTVTE